MKKTNWEKSRGMPFKHFPDVVYPSVFDIYVGVYFFLHYEKMPLDPANTANPIRSP